MPLEDLDVYQITGRMRGAYVDEPGYQFQGADGFIGLQEILQFLFDNSGGGGGTDRYVNAAELDEENNLILTLNNGSTVPVDLSVLAVDEDDFVTAADLDDTTLTITLDSGATVSVDLSSLVSGSTGMTIYDAGLGWIVKASPGVTVTSDAPGVYNFNIPNGGILDFYQKNFTNAGTEFTVGGDVVINMNWNTAIFNNSFGDAVLGDYAFFDGAGTEREPGVVPVTVQHTSVAGGQTSTTIANVNGLGTPVRIKGDI